MQGILHIVHTLWTCARISFNFLRKTYIFCMEGLYIFHGTAAHILWKNYTFSTETLPIFYRTVIHFVRKSCIFSTENPVHIRFYRSVMHLLRNSYTFSKEVLHIFYGTRVSLTGHRRFSLRVIFVETGMHSKVSFVIVTFVSLWLPYHKRNLPVRSYPEENYPE